MELSIAISNTWRNWRIRRIKKERKRGWSKWKKNQSNNNSRSKPKSSELRSDKCKKLNNRRSQTMKSKWNSRSLSYQSLFILQLSLKSWVRITWASSEDPRRQPVIPKVKSQRNLKSQHGLLPQSKKKIKKKQKLMILLSLLMILTMKSIWKTMRLDKLLLSSKIELLRSNRTMTGRRILPTSGTKSPRQSNKLIPNPRSPWDHKDLSTLISPELVMLLDNPSNLELPTNKNHKHQRKIGNR